MVNSNPNPNPISDATPSDLDLELVPRIRMDFIIVLVDGGCSYVADHVASLIAFCIKVSVRKQGEKCFDLPKQEVSISIYPTRERYRSKYVVPGFLFIRDLSFVRLFGDDSDDWETKFRKAILFLLKDMDCFYMRDLSAGNRFEFRPFINKSEDYREMIRLLQEGLSHEKSPTVVLKDVPAEWFADPKSLETLRAFCYTLGRFRNVDVGDNTVSIQFENHEECYKALKKLCSHSMQMRKNNELRMVDYGLTLKDLPDSDISQEILQKENGTVPMSQEISNVQDVAARLAQLEKELNFLKAKMGVSAASLSN